MRRALAPLLVFALACDGAGIVGPTTPRLGRSGVDNPSAAFQGTWRRIVFFRDDFGIARSTETTYQFAADGAMVRVQVTRNITFGVADVIVSAGRWRLEGVRLVLDFVSPSAFQLQLAAQRVGDQLDLAGQTFLRVVE